MTLLTNAINHLLELQMLNPQSLKVNVNVYLLRAQQIFRTAQAILTRNGVMNHHVQRELTMAEKRMYGDLKLFIQNARAENRWWLHAAPPPLCQPNQHSTTSTTCS
jgi:EAL domain-containing protein (putative c-di-GMP-specific phosphodiesterase class I)